jgi:ABC-2 type transport system permease protein
MKNILTVARRECGAYFGTPIAWIFIALQTAILSFFFFLYSPFFIIESADMRVWFGLTPFTMMVFAPAVTMRLWSEELRTGSTEVLLSLPLPVKDLVIGKWLASVVVLLASVVCSLGIPATISWMSASPVDWGPIMGGYIGTVLAGMMFLALGCWVSALSQNQVVSLLVGVTAGIVLVLALSPDFAAFLTSTSEPLARTVEALGVQSHFRSIERGVLAISDVVYFLSGSCLFLALTVFQVELKKQ